MTGPQHREYEGDYYGETHQKLAQQANHFGGEDRGDARAGVDGQTEKAASQYSVSQGDHLLQGQSTRGDAPVPDQHYPSSTHEELYNMVNTNLNPESLDDRGRVANKLGNWLSDVSTAAAEAAGSSEVEWQGPAAAQANGFFQATASYAEQSGSAAQLSSNRYSQQAAAAANAQKYMPPPSGFDQAAEMNKATQQLQSGDLVGGTNAMNAIAAKQQQAQAEHDQAVRVMQDLDNTYHTTAGTQPTYTPPPQLGGSDGSTFASSAHAPVVGGTAQGPGFAAGTSGGAPGSGQGSFSGTGTPFSGSASSIPGSGGAAGSGPSVGAGSSTGAGFGGPGFAPGGVRGGVGGFGGTGPRMTPDLSMLSGAQGTGGGAGEETTRGRSGPGSGRAGSGFAGSRVSGGGYKGGKPGGVPGEAEGKPGAGKSSGSGAVSERLERGATAASAKAAGAGGAGAAGAGAGKKKEEDKEHKNKIPVEIDPDEVFEVRPERGPDGEAITPPTIGG